MARHISSVDLGFGKACFVISIALLVTINTVNCREFYGTPISVFLKAHEDKATVDTNESSKKNEVGSVVEIGGLKTYVSGPSDSKFSVMLASDIFGYGVPNLRKIADKLGVAGYYAVVPDFFYGDSFNSSTMNYNTWKKNHPTAKAFEDSVHVVEALKRKGFSSIAAAGFCYGGHAAIKLAEGGLIQAVVFLHPTDVVEDDFKHINVPVEILGGELDTLAPPMVIRKYEEILSSKPEIPSFVKIFPGVEHGWTTRYNSTTEKAAEEAHQDLINWVNKYIKNDKTAGNKQQ